MREGQRITIPINTKGQPVGDNVNKLTNFLGTIARNGEYAPLTFTDWRAVSNEKKDDMLGLVMSKFEFDADAKKWVLQSIGRKWKDWKGELKKLYYSPHETDEERLANLDERVKEDQWKALIQFWNSKEGNARSKTSLENRKRQLIGHAAGSKSFARICEEERKKTASGEDPSRADVFILTHTCKSGRPVDEASLRVMEQLNEQISQQPDTSQNSTGRNDLFSQVMGEDRHGRVRTYGLGPTPTDLWGTTRSQRRIASAAQSRNEEYEGLQIEVSSLKSEVSSLKSDFSSFKESMAQLISSRTNLKSTVSDNSANLNLNQPASSSSQGHLAKKGKTTTCSSTGRDCLE
ncbi:uncharacterized protein LOC131228995 isoform X2 [Magnolia sinica]|uniref:uncharacterized protein LOC131228995 isoform X2 n=1 Tax=Magnolia sinica TaxID=86752 RepID=UPI00265AC196|nr:uncharacterized protein LOC131228995 isoform X2 [Magnolia sinica]